MATWLGPARGNSFRSLLFAGRSLRLRSPRLTWIGTRPRDLAVQPCGCSSADQHRHRQPAVFFSLSWISSRVWAFRRERVWALRGATRPAESSSRQRASLKWADHVACGALDPGTLKTVGNFSRAPALRTNEFDRHRISPRWKPAQCGAARIRTDSTTNQSSVFLIINQ